MARATPGVVKSFNTPTYTTPSQPPQPSAGSGGINREDYLKRLKAENEAIEARGRENRPGQVVQTKESIEAGRPRVMPPVPGAGAALPGATPPIPPIPAPESSPASLTGLVSAMALGGGMQAPQSQPSVDALRQGIGTRTPPSLQGLLRVRTY